MGMLMPLSDRCFIGTQAAGSYGEPRGAWTFSGTAERCLVMNEGPSEARNGTQIPTDAVRIAFRLDSGITASSRVRVTRRLWKTLAAAEEYEIDGAPKRVRGRLIAVCKRTTSRSTA